MYIILYSNLHQFNYTFYLRNVLESNYTKIYNMYQESLTSPKNTSSTKTSRRYAGRQSDQNVTSPRNTKKLSSIWKGVQDKYHLLELLGEGSFGQVVKAQHIATGKIYAIKLVTKVFKDEFTARKILREIQIQRVFSKMERNIFTTKIFDIITPEIDLSKV